MSDQPSPEDVAMMKKWQKQQVEADSLIEDPSVHTPTLEKADGVPD